MSRMIHRIVLESFGLDRFLEEHIRETEYHLRVIQYELSPAAGGCEEAYDKALPVHTDFGFITIIHQNQVNGLEIQTKTGEWIKCSSANGQFIVMVGDALHAWTNGRLYSPPHRVLLERKDTNKRYTLVLFAIPKIDHTIEAQAELIDEENPLLYKPYNMSEFFSKEGGAHLKNFSAI